MKFIVMIKSHKDVSRITNRERNIGFPLAPSLNKVIKPYATDLKAEVETNSLDGMNPDVIRRQIDVYRDAE